MMFRWVRPMVGHVRIATVPEKLDLAQDNTEIVDALTVQMKLYRQLQNELANLGRRSNSKAVQPNNSLVTCPRYAQSTMVRTVKERRRLLGLHQILPPVSRNSTGSRRLPS